MQKHGSVLFPDILYLIKLEGSHHTSIFAGWGVGFSTSCKMHYREDIRKLFWQVPNLEFCKNTLSYSVPTCNTDPMEELDVNYH